ncbi:MAG TPA: tRNA (adenosine(37)-N6)-threonylcarbamoyltransferase complex ATPase subunit type 1 TsaE [Candidatus Saccharimonadales bacterium]
MTFQIKSHSSEQTESLAAQIGAKLRGGEVIALNSDLGGGKTTFVRGLARGMGSQDHVSSPTFTIGRQYTSPGKKLALYHFDFYRLHEAGIMTLELAEALEDPLAVTVIEWSEIVAGVLPSTRLSINIISKSEHERDITIEYQPGQSYLMPDGEI